MVTDLNSKINDLDNMRRVRGRFPVVHELFDRAWILAVPSGHERLPSRLPTHAEPIASGCPFTVFSWPSRFFCGCGWNLEAVGTTDYDYNSFVEVISPKKSNVLQNRGNTCRDHQIKIRNYDEIGLELGRGHTRLKSCLPVSVPLFLFLVSAFTTSRTGFLVLEVTDT
eukprot:786591-Amorphochlora_amoeboformis.AAC.1